MKLVKPKIKKLDITTITKDILKDETLNIRHDLLYYTMSNSVYLVNGDLLLSRYTDKLMDEIRFNKIYRNVNKYTELNVKSRLRTFNNHIHKLNKVNKSLFIILFTYMFDIIDKDYVYKNNNYLLFTNKKNSIKLINEELNKLYKNRWKL